MAIKRNKKSDSGPSIPEALDNLLLGGFTATCLEKKYKEAGKEFRTEIVQYLDKNEDGFEIEISKSFKTEYGSVNMKSRKTYDVDSEAILEALKAGVVTAESLLAIAKFSATDLEKIGLGHCATEGEPTEFLELRASSDFKAKVDESFEAGPSPSKPKPAPKKAAPKKEKALSSTEKLKKARSKSKSVSADLDSILGE